jgi:tripartite-type tricarboxylate transporter receptor subunit TctC
MIKAHKDPSFSTSSSTRIGRRRALRIAVICGSLGSLPVYAQEAVERFYRGRQIDFYIGYAPGGGYDAYARLVARFIGHHIPGNPSVVPQNMPGGGTRVAAGYIYKVAPKDGAAIGIADQSLPLQQAVGDTTIQFDVNALNYIGNPAADINTVAIWHTKGIKSIEDARRTPVRIGATGPNTSSQIPMSINAVLNTNFVVVNGYPGGNEINLAMERGEVDGRGSAPLSSWKSTRPDWLRDNLINIIVQIGLKKADDLPNVPLLIDLATNENDRAALSFISAPAAVGRPIFAPPGVPEARIEALRAGFDAMIKDPAFLAAAKESGLDIDPVSGKELQQIVAGIVNSPKSVTSRLAGIFGVTQ